MQVQFPCQTLIWTIALNFTISINAGGLDDQTTAIHVETTTVQY